MSSFKEKYTLPQRKEESLRIKQKYPTRIPIIVERHKDSQIEDIDKHKYLVPDDLSIAQFMNIIRKRLSLRPDQALYIFINNALPPTSSEIRRIYTEHKDEDGFLYIVYAGESTFGNLAGL